MRIARLARKSYKGAWFTLLVLAALVLLAACGGGGSTTGTGATPAATATSGNTQAVHIAITTDSSGTFTFSPTSMTIKAGTTVTWTNMTQAPHTVTSDDGKSFDSGTSNPVNPQGTYSFKFTTPGTYHYHCQFHPFMKATIIVQ